MDLSNLAETLSVKFPLHLLFYTWFAFILYVNPPKSDYI